MEIKKNAKSKLENYSRFFMLLGLVWAFLITYLAVEYKSDRQNDFTNHGYFSQHIDNNIDIPITKPTEEATTSEPKTIIDKLDIVIDDTNIKEDILVPTDLNVDEPINSKLFLNGINEVNIKEPDDESVTFVAIEEAPTYPGCVGTKDDKKSCFISKISKFISKEFNASIAQELGLPSGKQRLFVMFTINKNGDITNIEARAPHKSLEKEAIRVIQSLPKMIPGKQYNKTVSVKYSLPIVYSVE
jgi:protein TonB